MRNDKLFTFCNLYIFLWLIYSLQSFVFGKVGTIYSTMIIFSLIGISAYHFVYALSNYKMPKYMKGLTVLVIMFTIYGAILILSGKTIRFMNSRAIIKNYNYIKTIYISLLPVFSFYVLTRKGELTKEVLLKWTPVFFMAAIVRFVQFQRTSFLIMAVGEEEEITNNIGYLFVSLIPLLVFWKDKRTIQYVGLAISMIFIILGMKRGAILTGAFSVVFFLYQSMKTASGKQKIKVILFSVVIVIISVYFLSHMLQNSAYFNKRLEDTLNGNSSGRDGLYGIFWRHFIHESNPLFFLFGNGAFATLTISSNVAHNDWLELAINQGLLGILVYIYYWTLFYKTWRKSTFDKDVYMAVGLILLIFFMKTLFSFSYTDMTVYDSLCLGYCMGMISEHDQQSMLETTSSYFRTTQNK